MAALHVSGFALKSNWKRVLRFLAIIMGGSILAVLLDSILGYGAKWVMIGATMSAVGSAIRGGEGEYAPDRPLRFSFPWSNVVQARLDPASPGGLVIRVKGGSHAGTLHFSPDRDPQGMLEALLHRMASTGS